MKMQLIFTAITMMLMCLCAQAQNATEGTLRLRNGNQVSGTVEMQADGSAKVVTATGDTFYFAANEITQFSAADGTTNPLTSSASSGDVVPGMKYWQYKKLYSARDYVPQAGDKYNPGLVTAIGALFPAIGQACVGRWGSALGHLAIDGACGFLIRSGSGDGTYLWVSLIGVGGAIINRVWSAVSANKVAKIKNQYFQDIRGLSSIQFEVQPYIEQIGTLAMQPQPVTGLSLRMTF